MAVVKITELTELSAADFDPNNDWVEVVDAGASQNKKAKGGVLTRVRSGDTPPASPGASQLWFDTSDGTLYVYYSGAWVEAGHTVGFDYSSDSPATSKSADFTFALSDLSSTVNVNSGSAVVATIPTDAAVNIPVGGRIKVFRGGSGSVRVVPDTGVTLHLPTGIKPKRFMGVLAKKSVDQTGANYTAATAVTWDAETYDTDGFHDTGSDTSRLTIPAGLGIKKVQVVASIRATAISADLWTNLQLLKDNAAFDGAASAFGTSEAAGEAGQSVVSASATVSDGSYFEASFQVQTDTSITITATRSSFGLEVTEIDAQGFVAYQDGIIEIEKIGANEWIFSDQSALG